MQLLLFRSNVEANIGCYLHVRTRVCMSVCVCVCVCVCVRMYHGVILNVMYARNRPYAVKSA